MFLDPACFLLKFLKWLFASLEGGTLMLWMSLSLALTIPDSVVCSGTLLNFKQLKVSKS